MSQKSQTYSALAAQDTPMTVGLLKAFISAHDIPDSAVLHIEPIDEPVGLISHSWDISIGEALNFNFFKAK